ncbi:ABC transporter ATP-binding protein [Oscillatoria salina]|uniref:ABC transporter ATP-binding protein n=1 Tax=Oscillatoria salina TaxID=331517 RepID=UPI0013B895EE|nr:ABC transporter ATP-binding protein [Oscillatoria salina]MBZ8183309.1 ABC transporter ATP-binding protein [Oscillatoria salina IIICB1]NET87090.1 ABC transporter ATP-binding protein [Kamptonema sp. SIO1D9]
MSKIKFEQVYLKFPGTKQPAVDGCSCEIELGEFVVILGPSGCGKTTFLKMVNRLYEPTSGRIYLDGTNIQRIKATTLRRQIGYVIQKSGLFPHMTVAENVAVVPKLLGWKKVKYQSRVDELLELVHLPTSEFRDRYPAQLSGGQQQRVGIARALAANPEVLLMDEPFGAIDAITRQSLQEEMLRLQRQLKKTVLFVSHDVEEALHLADRIIILNQGKIVQFDTPYNLLYQPANEFVEDLMGGKESLRQLSVLPVEKAMNAVSSDYRNEGKYTIAKEKNLRQALSRFLATGAEQLTVVDDGKVIGVVTWNSIRDAAGKD